MEDSPTKQPWTPIRYLFIDNPFSGAVLPLYSDNTIFKVMLKMVVWPNIKTICVNTIEMPYSNKNFISLVLIFSFVLCELWT